MFDLLFSFKGRIKRGKFFITSLLTGIAVITGLVVLLLDIIIKSQGLNGTLLNPSDIDIGGPTILMVFLIAGAGCWIQMSLVWKRTRDMSESMTVAYVYAACTLLNIIPVVGLFTGMLNLVLYLVMLFKPSRAPDNNTINPEVFGSESQPDDVAMEPISNFASNLSDADLVARAAQLREPKAPPSIVTPDAPIENAGRAAPKSFGRRTRLPH